jgi:hypothetical protein
MGMAPELPYVFVAMDAAALVFYFVALFGPDFTDWREEGPYRTLAECRQATVLGPRAASECYSIDLEAVRAHLEPTQSALASASERGDR